MELLVGEPLDRRIERLGRLQPIDTARILCQVCRALQRAHDAGIIHRDLKPENIFLVRSPDDDEEIAKVLDFGIAKFRGPPGGAGMSSSTKTGAVLGTPYYMSPEQARGLRNIDQRTDLWSLGVIAFKCVTGVLPFDGESVGDLLVKICTASPPAPSHSAPGIPASFDSWFAHALEREPERRFRSASELADALAMATGLSQRRSASQNGLPPYGPPQSAPHPRSQSQPDYSQPIGTIPSVTSSPFTASASLPKQRGVLFGLVLAGIVGASVGVIAVVKFVSSSGARSGPAVGSSSLASEASPGQAASHPPPLASESQPAVLPPAASSAIPIAPTAAAPPPPSIVHTAPRPAYVSKPVTISPPLPTASAAKSAPSVSLAPPPPPPPPLPSKPVPADPGY
jgi:serine/threonine-protein kinase